MIGAPATVAFGDAYEHVAVRLSDSGDALHGHQQRHR